MNGLQRWVDARKKSLNCWCLAADYISDTKSLQDKPKDFYNHNEGMPNWNAPFAPVPSLTGKTIASIAGQ